MWAVEAQSVVISALCVMKTMELSLQLSRWKSRDMNQQDLIVQHLCHQFVGRLK